MFFKFLSCHFNALANALCVISLAKALYHVVFYSYPKTIRYFFMNAFIAHNSQFSVPNGQVEQYPIAVLCFMHVQLMKNLDCSFISISFTILLHMQAYFTRCCFLCFI